MYIDREQFRIWLRDNFPAVPGWEAYYFRRLERALLAMRPDLTLKDTPEEASFIVTPNLLPLNLGGMGYIKVHTSKPFEPEIQQGPARMTGGYQLIEDVVPWSIIASNPIACDTETTGLHPTDDHIVGISLSTEEGRAWYLPIGHNIHSIASSGPSNASPKLIREVLNVLAVKTLVFHNAKFDLHGLLRLMGSYDIPWKGQVEDTKLVAYCKGLPDTGLKYLGKNLCGLAPPSFMEVTKGKTSDRTPISVLAPYACMDADITLRLWNLWKDAIPSRYHTLELPAMWVLYHMEERGVPVDRDALLNLGLKYGTMKEEVEGRLKGLAGSDFNPNSSPQVGKLLYEDLGLPATKVTPHGKKSTGRLTLEALNHPVADLIALWRQLDKLQGTYVTGWRNALSPDRRLHCRFNQTDVLSGRLSAEAPNLQATPVRTPEGKLMRYCVAGDDHLLVADFAHIELRVLAHLSGDPVLTEMFLNDEDPHEHMAKRIFGVEHPTEGQRGVGKTANFAGLYGAQKARLEASGIPPGIANKIVNLQYFPGMREYRKARLEEAKSGQVRTLLGHPINIKDIDAVDPRLQNHAIKQACNVPIQGTASGDITKTIMVIAHGLLEGTDCHLILQIHDEIIIEGPKAQLEALEPQIRNIMEHTFTLDVPLKADIHIAKSWGDAK